MVVKVTYNISNPFISISNQNPVVYIKVAYGSGGGSSSVVWGAITGTLSDQVDLQSALDAKVDDTTTITINGTTQDLSTDRTWNVGDMLKSMYDTDNNGIVDKAEKMTTICRNSTGATIYKGTIVYLSGSTGNRPNILKAIATSDATSAQTFGVVIADIANNSDGEVATLGTLDDLDTRSSATHPFTNDTLADGDILYLSPTTAGYVTNVKPYAPYHIVYCGMVVRTHPTLGTIVYRIQNGYELSEIHDCAVQTPSNNDGLFYESSTSLWKNKSIGTILGYTPVPSARTLTINGTGYDLSSDRSWTINSTNIYNTDGTLTGNRTISTASGYTLTFNPITTFIPTIASGDGITIKTNAVSQTGGTVALVLDYVGTGGAFSNRLISYRWNGTEVGYFYSNDGTAANTRFYSSGSIYAAQTGSFNSVLVSGTTLTLTAPGGQIGTINSQGTGGFVLQYNGTSNLKMFSTGNFVIQNGGTFSDAGYRLDVQGTGRFTGDVQFATSTSFDFGIGTSAGALYIKSRFPTTNGNANGIKINGSNTGSTATNILYATNTGNNTLYAPIVQWSGKGVLISYNDAENTTNDASSILEAKSTTKGFLPPRMTSTQRDAISSPATGLSIYNTTLNSLDVYDGARWRTDSDTVTTNRQTASYSLVLSDRGKLIEMNVASANTLTVPLNSSIAFPIGTKIDATQYGAGATTITATSGVTIRSLSGYLKLGGQYAACTLVKIGTDEWYCYGNLIA